MYLPYVLVCLFFGRRFLYLILEYLVTKLTAIFPSLSPFY